MAKKAAKRKFECKTSDEPTEEELIAEDLVDQGSTEVEAVAHVSDPINHVDVFQAADQAAEDLEIDLQLARSREMLKRRFGPYRPPTDETKPKFKQIQEAALIFAEMIFDVCPDCQQRSAAFTLLEQAKMLANASIAIHCHPTTVKKSIQV